MDYWNTKPNWRTVVIIWFPLSFSPVICTYRTCAIVGMFYDSLKVDAPRRQDLHRGINNAMTTFMFVCYSCGTPESPLPLNQARALIQRLEWASPFDWIWSIRGVVARVAIDGGGPSGSRGIAKKSTPRQGGRGWTASKLVLENVHTFLNNQ